MKKIILSISVILLFASFSKAQFTRYIIKFKNKAGNIYTFTNPSLYLSQRAVERRTRYNIAIDSTDLPVSPAYISQVAAIPNVTILNASKWLNQVSFLTTDPNAISSINNLSFVKSVSGIAARSTNSRVNKNPEDEILQSLHTSSSKVQTANDYYDYGVSSANEIHLHKGEFLHNIGLRGESMQIALIDAGFYNFNLYKAFDSINVTGRVLDTWDFVSGNSTVSDDDSHGMSCLSTIAANIPGQFVGMSPGSKFQLYRSEDDNSEYPIEEHNWVCAAERADSAGADVISSSLGYTTFDNAIFNHTYANLDGNTTMAAIGADLAAKKGILVFIAAGNSGGGTWHYIATPADADSVLAVGAVNVNGLKGIFSSFGPTPDGRVKPDVMSIGVSAVIETTGNSVGASNGTSFACPKMAGLGTCLWQAFPEYSNMKIIETLRQSGSTANNPTDSIGYGIPDIKLAFTKLLTEFATSQASLTNCTVALNWTSKDVSSMKYEIERKISGNADYIKIGELNAAPENTLGIHSYNFNSSATGVNIGTISYRVRQIVDTTTQSFTAVYIDTASVILNEDCGPASPSIDSVNNVFAAPNPVINDEINLIIESIQPIPSLLINIYDMQGRLILQQKQSKTAGRSVYAIHAAKLAKGKYTVVVYNGQSKFGSVKILKF